MAASRVRVGAAPLPAAPAALAPRPPPLPLAGAIGYAPPGLHRGGLGALSGALPRGRPILRVWRGDSAKEDEELALRDRALVEALAAQTRLLWQSLAGQRGGGNLDALLGGPSDAASQATASARAAAAMELQRRGLDRRPELSSRPMRELLAKANGTNANLPQDARALFQRYGSFPSNGRHRDLGSVAFLLANVRNKLELGDTPGAALRRSIKCLAAGRRNSASHGRSCRNRHKAPWTGRPKATPCSAGVIAAAIAYLKNLDAMAERMWTGPLLQWSPSKIHGLRLVHLDQRGDKFGRRQCCVRRGLRQNRV